MVPTAPDAAARLAAIVESSNDAIISKDLNGTIITWNRAAERLFGYAADEVIGRSITLLIPEARLPEETDTLARLRRGEVIDHFETVRRRKDGTLVDISLTISPIRAHDGTIVGASKIARDITDQRRFQRELQELHRRAAFLAEAATVLGASLDYQQTLRAVARLAVPAFADWCAVDILGERGRLQRLAVAHIDPAKVELARALEERYPTDPNAPNGVHQVIRTGEPEMMSRIPAALLDAAVQDDEHRRIIKELGLTSYICVPMLAHGKAFGAITFVSAESGHEYTEADLALAREIAARASLAVENARSYANANDANRLKDEFLATLSHELRTPLNAVLGYARMLRRGTIGSDKAPAALEVIERNGTALKQIIEDVLDVSRIVSGRLRLDVEPVDLPAVIHEASATIMPAADAKGIRLELVVDPQAATVAGDAGRIQQIVWNLLSNAIKFTSRGGKVQLRLVRVNSHVEIVVSDTGQGISPDFLPFVFDRFRQENATSTREHGGLGLGLAIAKQLAELHGGSMAAASEGIGKGSTFTLKLPVMIVHPAAWTEKRGVEHPAADRGASMVEDMPRLDGTHVLAVDDELDSLDLVRSVLEAVGARVTVASSGTAALEALRRECPDVLLADIGMTHMDGLQLIRAVRQQCEEPNRSVPAAALTAYARSQDRITSLASGFQMHLVKPVDPLELVVAVHSLATGSRRPPLM
jgi:PAS domain S-box-containing protein